MSKNVNHIQHVKSSVVENGLPKLPSAEILAEGEIAVNYADGVETLSIKSSSGNIATFSSDKYYTEKKLGSGFTNENSANTVTSAIDEIELVTAAALNDLDERKLDASAYTPTDLSNYYTKHETSGATELEEAFSAKTDQAWIEEKLGSGFTGENSANTVTKVIEDNENVISAALNDLESRKLDASAYTPTDLSNYYTKDETSGATELEEAFSGKADSDYVEEIELVTAAALNDLDERKMDISAYTPTDLSNYYTKDETSGATELEEAFSAKTDQVWIEEKLGEYFIEDNSANTVTSVIRDNELVIAAALNDLDEMKLDASAYTPTDLSNYYTKQETSGASEISTALSAKLDATAYTPTDLSNYYTKDETSGATELEEAFSGKADSDYVEEIEEAISAALNDLEERKMDASAYTPTDLSNYYTKQQTYNKTEVDTAIANVDISDQLSAYTEVSAFTEYSAATEERMDDNELATAEAINNLYYRIEDFISAYTPTDFRNYYTKQETSGSSEISAALSEKEDTLAIDSTAKTSSFSAEIGKYYFVNVPDNGSVTVTLPTSNVSSTNVQNIIFLVTLGSGTSSITFTPIAFVTEGFNDMEASNTYEVNALWNGTNWIMAMTKLEAAV